MEHEIRFASAPVEIRAEGGTVAVTGYAAVFGEVADIAGYFDERIAPGAFAAALTRGDDVTFLINHDGLPLARTRSGTLRLSEDDRGLRMETELDPDDPDVQAILPKMKRGDLDKMSFAFVATRQSWDETGEKPLRTVEEVRLYDVSIVTEPAYGGTEIGLRALRAARGAGEAAAHAARRARMRMKLRLTGAA
ncbi:HK97 family phage prohead protease [Rhodovulum sp. DZ06]|uniref:HK97 family phage prohead protease n=1 Tax=Rhodovulum sp. DZ06 TaxID=3425126 RepID=UPI003D35357E